MKAEDLNLSELVGWSDGVLDLHGRRLVLHSVDAFAQFRKDVVGMVGLDQARRVFTRFGNFWGRADAAAMKRIYEWDSTEEWLKAGPRMHALQGVVRVMTKKLEMEEGSGRFRMEVVWHDSGEAEEHLSALGKASEPSCWMLVGYASGYASFCLGREVYFIETTCRARGDGVCAAVGKDRDSWGEELAPHLPYFQAEDIHGEVMRLTKELKEKTRELARERSRVKRLERVAAASPAEVRSRVFQHVVELASRVAQYDSSVLITGESGTGKEVLARYIHRLSPRAEGPFVAVNCGALPETLLESELFGHKAGAFTGATRDRVGLFEEAEKGTLFLDEVGEVSPGMQVKLLRALQEKEITRVGENRSRRVDMRVLAATNLNLRERVRQGRFREDLYYRLGVIEIEVPPLRERREDILPLARYLVQRISEKLKIPNLRLDAKSLDLLTAHTWPGNVRELENAMERAAVLSRDGVIRPEDLPSVVVRPMVEAGPGTQGGDGTLADVEREHIRTVLESTGGNRAKAARILGIGATTLWRRMRQGGAEPQTEKRR